MHWFLILLISNIKEVLGVYRKIYSKITEFKKNGFNKPIMILGARQVGKTYILDDFAAGNMDFCGFR